jgi:hypothetical protein
LAERLQVPLLFVGNDFSHTDLERALLAPTQGVRISGPGPETPAAIG